MKTLLRGAATLLTAALLCFNLFYELAPNLVVGPEKKFAFAAAFAVLLRIALFCGIPEAQRQRRRRLYMQLLLYYYMWVLANVLFFDNAFGRGFTTHATLEAINLEPLRTIKNYLLAYGYGNISLRLVILNLAGNLIAFAPMGVFLARRIPLAAQHLLLHRDADARHHGGRGRAGLHGHRLVRHRRPHPQPRRCTHRLHYLPRDAPLAPHLQHHPAPEKRVKIS